MCKYHWVDDMNTHSVIVPNLSPLPPESPRILPAWFTMITSSEGHISKHRSRLALRGRRIPSHPLRTTEQAGLACAAAARTLAFTPVVAAERPREAVAGQRAAQVFHCQHPHSAMPDRAGRQTWRGRRSHCSLYISSLEMCLPQTILDSE